MSWASFFWSPDRRPMKSLVPLLAMVPRWSMASCSLMPMPLSVMVMVLASLSNATRTSRLGASSFSAVLFKASNRNLSQASDALETNSRRKISWLEYKAWVTRCNNWATSAWNAWVCLLMVGQGAKKAYKTGTPLKWGVWRGFQGLLRSKRLIGGEVAPLAHRQVAQAHLADAHPLQPHHKQPHLLAHAPDLAFFTLAQHKAQLFGVLPLHLGRFERLTAQAQAMPQPPDRVGRACGLNILAHHQALWAVGAVLDANQVLLLNPGVFADQGLGDTPVLCEHQQASGIDVQAAGGRQATGVGGFKTAGGAVVPPAGPGPNQNGRALVAIFGQTADVAHRLVQQNRHPGGLAVLCAPLDVDLVARHHGLPHLGHLAIDTHPPFRDPVVGLAPGTMPQIGQTLVQAGRSAIAGGRWGLGGDAGGRGWMLAGRPGGGTGHHAGRQGQGFAHVRKGRTTAVAKRQNRQRAWVCSQNSLGLHRNSAPAVGPGYRRFPPLRPPRSNPNCVPGRRWIGRFSHHFGRCPC